MTSGPGGPIIDSQVTDTGQYMLDTEGSLKMTGWIHGGHCRDCRWWNRFPYGSKPDKWGWCEIGETSPMEDGSGHWANAHEEKSQALAVSDPDEGASLATAPTFGCVQWEAKESVG